jgi:hypothetical protein
MHLLRDLSAIVALVVLFLALWIVESIGFAVAVIVMVIATLAVMTIPFAVMSADRYRDLHQRHHHGPHGV